MILVDIAVVLGSLGIPGAIAWAVHKVWPRVRAKRERERAKDFAILGGPVVDPLSGKVIATQPPLGQWMSGIKDDISNLSTIVARQSEQSQAIAGNTAALAATNADVAQLKIRVDKLEDIRVEKIVNQAESAQMLRLIADENNPGQPAASAVELPTDPSA